MLHHLCTECDDLVQPQEAKCILRTGELLQAYTSMCSRFRGREINLLLATTLGERPSGVWIEWGKTEWGDDPSMPPFCHPGGEPPLSSVLWALLGR